MSHRHSVEDQSSPFHVPRLGGQFPGVPLSLNDVVVASIDGGILRFEHRPTGLEEDFSDQSFEEG